MKTVTKTLYFTAGFLLSALISHTSFAQMVAVPGTGYTGSVGSRTSCASVRSVSPDGRSISGGSAGFTASSAGFTGGGQTFPVSSHTYECAGASISGGTDIDIEWPAFDIEPDPEDSPEEQEEKRLEWYGLSTRDKVSLGGTGRGRSGKNSPLFMNEHGVCRKIDNTAGTLESLFVDVSSPETWRTVHGVAEGADPNGGYSTFANRADLPSVNMTVCCSPVEVTICGNVIRTEYAQVGDVASLFGGSGGFATLRCASNNNWVLQNVHGVCGSGNDGGGNQSGGSGYSNPNNGGSISEGDWDSLSADVQDSLTDSGYGPSAEVSTDAVGNNDINQAQEQEAAEDAAEQAERDAIAAAEAAAAAQAAEDAAEDAADDDDDD